MEQQERPQDNERRRSKYHRSLPRIMGGLILVVLGVSFIIANQGLITRVHWWEYFIVGLGLVFIIDWVIRSFTGERPRFSGRLIAGIILIGVGLVFLTNIGIFWPVILIIIGLIVLLAGVLRNRR